MAGPRGTGQAAKLREAIAGDLPEIIESIVRQAKDGDVQAAKLLLDRVVPALKPQQAQVTIEGLANTSRADQARTVVAALGAGEVSPEQSQSLLAGIDVSDIEAGIDVSAALRDLVKGIHNRRAAKQIASDAPLAANGLTVIADNGSRHRKREGNQ